MLLARKTERCPECGNFVLVGDPPHICPVGRLLAVLDGLEVTDGEMRVIRWLAGWEKETVNNVIRLLEKCRDTTDTVRT